MDLVAHGTHSSVAWKSDASKAVAAVALAFVHPLTVRGRQRAAHPRREDCSQADTAPDGVLTRELDQDLDRNGQVAIGSRPAAFIASINVLGNLGAAVRDRLARSS